jgi:hypothetical protein
VSLMSDESSNRTRLRGHEGSALADAATGRIHSAKKRGVLTMRPSRSVGHDRRPGMMMMTMAQPTSA